MQPKRSPSLSIFNELKRRNVIRVGVAYAVAAWVLLQVADLVLENINAPEWVIQALMLVVGLGFIAAVIIAWAYELTPEGIKHERDVIRGESITHTTGRKLDRIIMGFLVVAVAFFAWDRLQHPQTVESIPVEETSSSVQTQPSALEPDDEIAIVAVLPFTATGSEDGGFLAAGLHDDLLTRLAKLGAFRVISRTSMMEYAGTTKNMRQIGEEVGAGYILEGGVQAMGNRVRINAQLIDADTDEHLWAEIYDHELTPENLFDVQAKLAVAIANALHTELSPTDLALVEDVPTKNMSAYAAYLRGMETARSHLGVTSLQTAIEALEEAVRLDPNFALAWAGLATAFNRTRSPDYSEAALAALAKARTLSPGLIESEIAWADYLYQMMNEWAQALETLEVLGERVAGHKYAWYLKAWSKRRLGQTDSAYQDLLNFRQLSPREPDTYFYLTRFAWQSDKCEAAEQHVEQLVSFRPEASGTKIALAEYELQCNGNAQHAADLVRNLDPLTYGPWQVPYWAAHQTQDAQLLLKIINTDRQGNPAWPIWQQLELIEAGSFVELNEAEVDHALAKAEELLGSYESDPELAQGTEFAALKRSFHPLNGDVTETIYWIKEEKRRVKEERNDDQSAQEQNYTWSAMAYQRVGLLDEAVEELRLMLEQPGGHRFPWIDSGPVFDDLKSHPGYIALKEKFGN